MAECFAPHSGALYRWKGIPRRVLFNFTERTIHQIACRGPFVSSMNDPDPGEEEADDLVIFSVSTGNFQTVSN